MKFILFYIAINVFSSHGSQIEKEAKTGHQTPSPIEGEVLLRECFLRLDLSSLSPEQKAICPYKITVLTDIELIPPANESFEPEPLSDKDSPLSLDERLKNYFIPLSSDLLIRSLLRHDKENEENPPLLLIPSDKPFKYSGSLRAEYSLSPLLTFGVQMAYEGEFHKNDFSFENKMNELEVHAIYNINERMSLELAVREREDLTASSTHPLTEDETGKEHVLWLTWRVFAFK